MKLRRLRIRVTDYIPAYYLFEGFVEWFRTCQIYLNSPSRVIARLDGDAGVVFPFVIAIGELPLLNFSKNIHTCQKGGYRWSLAAAAADEQRHAGC
jgi:hypothetical protein